MVEVSSNIEVVIRAKLDELKNLKDNPDPILRTVAIAVLTEMKVRVHKKGLDSKGNKIGTYSPGYMKVRTGDFKNSGRKVKGKEKGKLKDAGTFTKKKVQLYGYFDKGVFVERTDNVARPRYNRSNDPTVILSLTRQMENDETVVQTPSGYGIGFLNSDNYQKAMYCEHTYDKPILTQLTPDELDLAKQTVIDFLPEYFKPTN